MAGQQRQSGFTLIEIMVTMAIISALAALTFINLGAPQTTGSLNSTVDTLVADLKTQQLLAMTGDSGSSSAQQPHGIVITADDYTLFAGAAFDDDDSNNYTLALSEGVSLSTDLDGSQILFDKGSGEVMGLADEATITVQRHGESKTITINHFGTVTVQ